MQPREPQQREERVLLLPPASRRWDIPVRGVRGFRSPGRRADRLHAFSGATVMRPNKGFTRLERVSRDIRRGLAKLRGGKLSSRQWVKLRKSLLKSPQYREAYRKMQETYRGAK